MIRFRFELRPLDEVLPWGRDQPRLHWFGLTEGRYWIEVGKHRLLRRRTRDDRPHPCVDYYLARLWEDVNVLTPDVLESVPADLMAFIASEPAQWVCDWLGFVHDGREDVDPESPDHPVVTAAIWHGEHYLDFGYLRNPPRVRLWRAVHGDSDRITVDWRHDDDGEIGFTAGPTVRISVSTTEYLEAVRELDRELMATMRQRVDELQRRGGLPGVDLDLASLRREHDDRAGWLASNLDRSRKTDWDAVREGAQQLLGNTRHPDAPTAN